MRGAAIRALVTAATTFPVGAGSRALKDKDDTALLPLPASPSPQAPPTLSCASVSSCAGLDLLAGAVLCTDRGECRPQAEADCGSVCFVPAAWPIAESGSGDAGAELAPRPAAEAAEPAEPAALAGAAAESGGAETSAEAADAEAEAVTVVEAVEAVEAEAVEAEAVEVDPAEEPGPGEAHGEAESEPQEEAQPLPLPQQQQQQEHHASEAQRHSPGLGEKVCKAKAGLVHCWLAGCVAECSSEIAPALLLLLIVGMSAHTFGSLLSGLGFPAITTFLFFGVVAGPYGTNIVSAEEAAKLTWLNNVALGFIGLSAGGKLHLNEVRENLSAALSVLGGLVTVTYFGSITTTLLFGHIVHLAPPRAGERGCEQRLFTPLAVNSSSPSSSTSRSTIRCPPRCSSPASRSLARPPPPSQSSRSCTPRAPSPPPSSPSPC